MNHVREYALIQDAVVQSVTYPPSPSDILDYIQPRLDQLMQDGVVDMTEYAQWLKMLKVLNPEEAPCPNILKILFVRVYEEYLDPQSPFYKGALSHPLLTDEEEQRRFGAKELPLSTRAEIMHLLTKRLETCQRYAPWTATEMSEMQHDLERDIQAILDNLVLKRDVFLAEKAKLEEQMAQTALLQQQLEEEKRVQQDTLYRNKDLQHQLIRTADREWEDLTRTKRKMVQIAPDLSVSSTLDGSALIRLSPLDALAQLDRLTGEDRIRLARQVKQDALNNIFGEETRSFMKSHIRTANHKLADFILENASWF